MNAPRPATSLYALILALLIAVPIGSLAGEGDTVDFNTASSFKLVKVAYISRDVAKAIVRHRDANGPFKQPQDLLAVSGVDAALLEKISPWVDGNGALVAARMGSTDAGMAIPDY